MTLQVQHPVPEWYLAFDDLWELMRVNWQTHNPFTQNGMWDAGEHSVQGVLMVVDRPPYRAVLLNVENGTDVEYVAIVTYGPKCPECGYTPYNALWHQSDDGDDDAIVWGASTIAVMIDNARENGVERRHEDECSRLVYPDEEGEEDATQAE